MNVNIFFFWFFLMWILVPVIILCSKVQCFSVYVYLSNLQRVESFSVHIKLGTMFWCSYLNMCTIMSSDNAWKILLSPKLSIWCLSCWSGHCINLRLSWFCAADSMSTYKSHIPNLSAILINISVPPKYRSCSNLIFNRGRFFRSYIGTNKLFASL